MTESRTYSYTIVDNSLGLVDRMPYLPLTLHSGDRSVEARGLLDTGASINVLPYHMGETLGFNWEQETLSVQLVGNLALFEARAVVVSGRISPFPTVDLAFAWTQAENVPLILGQVNFFLEFEVCFYRARSEFSVRPKSAE